jgi:hypothetical protein
MLLKPDTQIKEAFASAVGTRCLNRAGSGSQHDPFALREIVVPCDAKVQSMVKRLHHFPGAAPGEESNLLTEVIQFCPIPLRVWQERAHEVLIQRVAAWRRQLEHVRDQLRGSRMCTLPFGRFVAATESVADWVPNVDKVTVPVAEFFSDWEGSDVLRHHVWYFRRPYVIWSPESPGSLIHSIRLDSGKPPVRICRPPLTNDDLDARYPLGKPAK